jgi:hypothetical protein
MKIKKDRGESTSEFWYDLTDGGYLDPDKMCADKKDAKRVKEAIKVIQEFYSSCEEQIEGFVQ